MVVRDERMVRFAAGRVRRALERTRVRVTARAYRHLVGVLCLPARDRWFASEGVHEPLARWYRRGVSEPTGSPERAYLLGFVGDVSLLVSGFWWQRHGSLRDARLVEEVIGLGRQAYRNIDEEPYGELAAKYRQLADMMVVLSAHYTADRERQVVGLCEAWRHGRDARIARILRYLDLPAGLLEPGIPS